MYILPKFLSKLIKQDGFVLISHSKEKFVIGNPLKKDPMEVKILKKGMELKLALYPEKYFPEGLIHGDIVIDKGTIEDFITITMDNIGRGNISFINEVFSKAKSLIRLFFYYDSKFKSKKDIGYHYDIDPQVFKWMLGESMVYSCAYWDKGGPEKQSLEDAQRAKLKFIQKKLMFNDQDTLLDIGSGFGSFIFSVAENYNIPIYGVTLSKEQIKFCQERQQKLNLGNSNISFQLKDFRDLEGQKFSKISSIGQFEHCNSKLYRSYFKKIYDLLTETGIAIVHYIGSNTSPGPESEFIQRYIFPHGRCPSLSEVIPAVEKSGLILSDIDTWRVHYHHTLNEWYKRFMDKKKEITKLMGEKFVRVFRIYLHGCSRTFLHDLQVYQLTLTKKIDKVPITKNYLYN